MTTHEQFEPGDEPPTGPTVGAVDRRKDVLLPIVAHELRQPLSAILMALSVHDECDDESSAREARDIAKHGALQMSRIIDDVIDVYRDAHGKLRLRLAPMDLATIVRHSIETARPGLAARGHRLSVSLPPDPVSFLADASRLEQVLTNLLTNAANCTEPGGHIYVTGDVPTDEVVIRVRDNGRGICPDLLPRIFDPFQQGNDSGDRPGGALGLGLALVKSLVELHGGSVAAHSEGLGMGSEFVVRLPTGPSFVHAERQHPQ